MKINGKIIALDVGTVRIGVASSDIMQILASPLEVIKRTNPVADAIKVAELVKKLDAQKIVVGLPLQMSGEEGKSVAMVKDFVKVLQTKTSVPIIYQDERLSTVSAEKILIESGVRREKRKGIIDSVAAVIILQNHLDKHKE